LGLGVRVASVDVDVASDVTHPIEVLRQSEGTADDYASFLIENAVQNQCFVYGLKEVLQFFISIVNSLFECF
jgi:hypothetical protein